MAGLYTKVCLYLEANSKSWDDAKILLQDDGSGPYIKEWNVDGLAKPSDSQIASYETAGNTVDSNNLVRRTRKQAYGDIGEQLDQLYHDMTAGKLDTTGEWHKAIKKIKDDNPKG